MANFTVQGMQDLVTAFNSALNIPDDVKKKCLKTMGVVTKDYEASSAISYGLVDTHQMIDSLSVTSPNLTTDGGSVFVTFKGSRTDKKHKKPTRNAEIAFINEYGSNEKGISAKPFISDAIKKNEEKIVDAGQDVLNQWIDFKY